MPFRKSAVRVILASMTFTGNAQSSVKSTFTKVFNCHQKKRCQSLGEDYQQDLMIKFNENELSWTKSIYEGWTTSEVRKKSEDYVIAIKEELYTFADLKTKSIYYIDFFRDSYQTWGYRPDTVEVNNRVRAMMDMLMITRHRRCHAISHRPD